MLMIHLSFPFHAINNINSSAYIDYTTRPVSPSCSLKEDLSFRFMFPYLRSTTLEFL